MTFTAEQQLAAFLERFTPKMAALGSAVIARLRERLPHADALIFDNFNFLGVGLSTNGKSSGIFLSFVLYPRWANLFFFKGALLNDPSRALKGEGKIIRHVRLESLADFEKDAIDPLIAQAEDLCEPPVDPSHRRELMVHTVAARQRPRRPNLSS